MIYDLGVNTGFVRARQNKSVRKWKWNEHRQKEKL